MKLGRRPRTDPALTLAKLRDVVSPHCGIVTGMTRWLVQDPRARGTFGYGAGVETATVLGYAAFRARRAQETEVWREGAQGRDGNRVAFDRTRAFVRAVGEALERYASCTYDPARLVTAPWAEVKDRALDPLTLQRPTREEYAFMDNLQPFRPDAPMRWVEGWSLRDATPRLVPAQLAWLMYNPVPGEPRMLTGTSTGWALHHTMEEAIHAGLREVVERDSFFIAWLNRLRLPRLDLDAVRDPAVRTFADRLKAEGAELRVLVTTTDYGIPSFAACVVDRRPGKPAFLLTLAAHPDPVRGLRQVVEEAAMMRLDALFRVQQGAARHAPPRMEDARRMSDHGSYYLLRENLGPVAFLLDDDAPVVPLPQGFGSDDAWAEVRGMVDRIAAAGHDVLAVDGTPDDLREAGWRAAKVLVPGSVRHEYGYGARFLDCPRIYHAPVRMGHRKAPSTPADLNPDLHPYS